MKKETKYEMVKSKMKSMGRIISFSFGALVSHVENLHKLIHVFEKAVKKTRKKRKNKKEE